MDITPSPRILRMLGEIEFAEWQCVAELIDNAFDDFTEILQEGLPWPGGFRVSVTLPTAKARLTEAEIVVQDTGRGMSRTSLENAVRAGWSSNDRFDKLGLFGMGFNVSTARLGDRTQVFTTQDGDAEWTGVEIDLKKIKDDFQAKDLSEVKRDLSEHGTKIIVSQLKPRHAQWLGRNANQLREVLGRTYSWILDSSPIELWVGGVQVQARRPCHWSEDRYVTYGAGRNAEQIPAVIRIDQTYSTAEACGQCGNWQDPGQAVCQACSSPSLQARERRIHGWLGIQRHLDTRSYGVDFLRNGRKILQFDKRIFDWTDPNDPVAGTTTEYPVEMVHLGGRIIGEIHLDHVPVTYSKDAFEYSDRSWRGAMDYLRGHGPLLPKTAERNGYPRNTSPLARLVEGYRRVDAGRRNLIPGDGKGPIHAQTREWAKQYWSGIEEFQTDQKWWDAVNSHEDRKSAASIAVATGKSPDQADEDAVVAALGGEVPSLKSPHVSAPPAASRPETMQERLDRLRDSISVPELSRPFALPDLGTLDVEAFTTKESPLLDDLGHITPVWLQLGTGRTAKAFIDPQHPLFVRFGATYADALLMELAPLMKIRAQSDLKQSQIIADLRMACLVDTAIDFSTIKNQASDLVFDIRTRASKLVGDDPQRAVQYLTPDEHTIIENGIINDGGEYTTDVWKNGTFLLYAPPLYLVKLLESWPEAFMDGKVFRGPYATVSSPITKRLSVAKIVGYLNDLAAILVAQLTPSTAQLQRIRWSCELLASELTEQ